MKITRVNIGEVIKEKVVAKGLSKAVFAKSINIQRQNIDKTVFEKNSLDTELLCRISEVLECNLFDYFKSDMNSNKSDYIFPNELKATLTIEMGSKKSDKVFHLILGENDLEIK